MNQELKELLTQVQKPGRYTGGEPGTIYKNKSEISLRVAFCFPDVYEVGMSYLGMKILYELLNREESFWCERAFMPWIDMAQKMKQANIPLYALESKDPLHLFDIIGFTLQYELSYTNILAMLDLAGLPLCAKDRGEDFPLVIGGGPCTCNPEPVAEFFDLFLIGEGEELFPQICKQIQAAKESGVSKSKLLRDLADLDGIYVPSLYKINYLPDGRIQNIEPLDGVKPAVKKVLLKEFSNFSLPENFVVPMVGAIHDRAQIEVMRGCARGCRFCQAGFFYRPLRERASGFLNQSAKILCENTGYEELSLTSLSTSDHSELEPLLDELLEWTPQEHINLSLPSLRVDNFTKSLVEKTTKVRKSSLTFAPEAGTQRLRDVINKNVTDEEIDRTCNLAFDAGYNTVKLYFMMGLPTETLEDIQGIADTAGRVVELYYANPNRNKKQGIKVTLSVACFVPKPFTPFEICGQDTEEQLREKQEYLLQHLRSKKIKVNYHDSRISFLEAVFARGDRKLAPVLERAYRAGCCFDGWDEQFQYDTWLACFREEGIDPGFYAHRTLGWDEVFPWSHLDFGIEKSFLVEEYRKATQGETTLPCNKHCAGCGISQMLGEKCFA